MAIILPIVSMAASVWIALLVMERHRRALERGVCPQCGYDVARTESHVCPECGHALYATSTSGRAPLVAEVLALPAAGVTHAILPPGFDLVGRLSPHLGVLEPIARSAVVCAAMLLSALVIGAAFTVRRTPRELSGVLLVYLVGTVDTAIAWFVVLAGPG